jgi:hypothetical protein
MKYIIIIRKESKTTIEAEDLTEACNKAKKLVKSKNEVIQSVTPDNNDATDRTT